MNHVDLEEIHFQISSKTAPSYPIDWSKSQVSSVVMRLSLELFSRNLDTRGKFCSSYSFCRTRQIMFAYHALQNIYVMYMCSTVAQQDGNQQF